MLAIKSFQYSNIKIDLFVLYISAELLVEYLDHSYLLVINSNSPFLLKRVQIWMLIFLFLLFR